MKEWKAFAVGIFTFVILATSFWLGGVDWVSTRDINEGTSFLLCVICALAAGYMNKVDWESD